MAVPVTEKPALIFLKRERRGIPFVPEIFFAFAVPIWDGQRNAYTFAAAQGGQLRVRER